VIIGQRHAGMMHDIADLALFGHSSLILSGLMRFVFHPVLVGIYHQLSCCETEQHDPGVNDMFFNSSQNLIAFDFMYKTHFAQK
jgi:hypothetical protein